VRCATSQKWGGGGFAIIGINQGFRAEFNREDAILKRWMVFFNKSALLLKSQRADERSGGLRKKRGMHGLERARCLDGVHLRCKHGEVWTCTQSLFNRKGSAKPHHVVRSAPVRCTGKNGLEFPVSSFGPTHEEFLTPRP